MCWIYLKRAKKKRFRWRIQKSQPSFYFPSRFKESYVFAKKDDFPTKAQYTSPVAAVVAQSTDFPTLGETMPGYSAQLVSEKPVKVEATTRKQPNFSVEEDFFQLWRTMVMRCCVSDSRARFSRFRLCLAAQGSQRHQLPFFRTRVLIYRCWTKRSIVSRSEVDDCYSQGIFLRVVREFNNLYI